MMDVFLVLAALVLVLAVIWYFRRSDDVLMAQGIRGPTALPLMGTSVRMFKLGILDFDKLCRKKYGKLVRHVNMGNLSLMVFDADMLKEIMIKEASVFTDHFRATFVPPKPFHRGLTTLTGDDWRRVRHAISPTFTSGKLKKMTPLIFSSVELLSNKLLSLAGRDIDVKDIFRRFTMSVIAETMFGMRISAMDGSHEFLREAGKIINVNFRTIVSVQLKRFPVLGRLFRNASIFDLGAVAYLVRVVERAIQERRGREDEFHDFLSLMLKAEIDEGELDRPGEKVRGLTNDEIISQAVLFLLAGNETTSVALTYTAFLLTLHPDAQERCRDEVLAEFHDDSPEAMYESVGRLTFLDQCLKESLRLYPPAGRTDRVSNQDVLIGGVRVPKGCTILIPIASVLRDPELWEEPDRFNPDRFAPGSTEASKVPFNFLVFGNGPRNCIGKRFAMLEAKLALADILRKMRLVTCESTPKEPLEFGLIGISKPKHTMTLRVEPID